MSIKFFAVFVLSILPLKSHTQDFYENEKSVPKSAFSQIVISNKLAGYPVLIPDKPWVFMFSKIHQSTGTGSGVPIGETYGAFLNNNTLHYAIDNQINLAERSNISDWTDEPCKSDDFLWKRSTGGKFNNINCATIDFNPIFKSHAASIFLGVFGKIRKIDYKIPETSITVTFTRYSSSGRRLQYVVNINPEVYNFSPEIESNRLMNAWHRNISLKDSKKSKFIENIASWATSTQDRMDKAFEKDANAFKDLKGFSEYLLDSKDVNSKKEANLEDKLTQLKLLHSKGLINDFQYNEQVKDALNK